MKSELFEGRYWFHLHTSFTDADLSVGDYFSAARAAGVDRLIFLEHVRRMPSYPVLELLSEVRRCAKRTGIAASVGFEAKLLPNGELDLSEEHIALAEVVGMAEHALDAEPEALEALIAQAAAHYLPILGPKPIVWVHPGLSLLRKGIIASRSNGYWELIGRFQASGILIERNLRYDLVPAAGLDRVAPESLVVGLDAHTRKDLPC